MCTNTVASGKPACGKGGGDAILAAVQHELVERRAVGVQVTACACLGPCFDGPNAVLYPDGVWYGGLTPDDAPALASHLVDGVVHVAKQVEPPGSE